MAKTSSFQRRLAIIRSLDYVQSTIVVNIAITPTKEKCDVDLLIVNYQFWTVYWDSSSYHKAKKNQLLKAHILKKWFYRGVMTSAWLISVTVDCFACTRLTYPFPLNELTSSCNSKSTTCAQWLIGYYSSAMNRAHTWHSEWLACFICNIDWSMQALELNCWNAADTEAVLVICKFRE